MGTVFGVTQNIDSGTCSQNISWSLDNIDGVKTLTISGTGAMPDYDNSTRPGWENDYADDIETVVFESGITTIGACLFYNADWNNRGELYPNLKVVIINGTITSINSDAFSYLYNLERFNSARQYEMIIPDSVEKIAKNAFMDCDKLKNIQFADDVELI